MFNGEQVQQAFTNCYQYTTYQGPITFFVWEKAYMTLVNRICKLHNYRFTELYE